MIDKEFQLKATAQGKRFADRAKDDMDALEHARDCSGKTSTGAVCKMGQQTKTIKYKDGTKLKVNQHENPDAWHDEDQARREIEEAPLSVEVRSGWYSPGNPDADRDPSEYRVLLGTGGPAAQIVGDLDQYLQPSTARYQFQDWFKPWTDAQLDNQETDAILAWVKQLYFGD